VSDETPAASCAAKAAIRSFSSRRSRSITTRRGVCSQQLLSDRGDLRGRGDWSVGHAVWLLVAPTTSCTFIRCGVRCWRWSTVAVTIAIRRTGRPSLSSERERA